MPRIAPLRADEHDLGVFDAGGRARSAADVAVIDDADVQSACAR